MKVDLNDHNVKFLKGLNMILSIELNGVYEMKYNENRGDELYFNGIFLGLGKYIRAQYTNDYVNEISLKTIRDVEIKEKTNFRRITKEKYRNNFRVIESVIINNFEKELKKENTNVYVETEKVFFIENAFYNLRTKKKFWGVMRIDLYVETNDTVYFINFAHSQSNTARLKDALEDLIYIYFIKMYSLNHNIDKNIVYIRYHYSIKKIDNDKFKVRDTTIYTYNIDAYSLRFLIEFVTKIFKNKFRNDMFKMSSIINDCFFSYNASSLFKSLENFYENYDFVFESSYVLVNNKYKQIRVYDYNEFYKLLKSKNII